MSKKTVIFIALALLLIIMVASSLLRGSSSPSSPIPSLPIQIFRPTSPTSSPQNTGFSQQESALPSAYPQVFASPTNQTGELVVTSPVDLVRVQIDGPSEEVGLSTQTTPINSTPFTIKAMPVGSHTIFAFKEGYAPYTSVFTVSPNQVTRIEIILQPNNNEVGY
jgi:hypothetical protein